MSAWTGSDLEEKIEEANRKAVAVASDKERLPKEFTASELKKRSEEANDKIKREHRQRVHNVFAEVRRAAEQAADAGQHVCIHTIHETLIEDVALNFDALGFGTQITNRTSLTLRWLRLSKGRSSAVDAPSERMVPSRAVSCPTSRSSGSRPLTGRPGLSAKSRREAGAQAPRTFPCPW